MYNLTNLTSSSNAFELFVNVNQISNGLFFPLIMMSLFIIILISNINRFDIRKILIVDSLFISLIGFMGMTLGLVDWWVIVFPLVIFVGSLISLLTIK